MTHHPVQQGSPEWHALRCGSLGASQIADATARTKAGWSASREAVKAKLIAERLSGQSYGGYVNAAMQRGTDTEPAARTAYSFLTGRDAVPCGLFTDAALLGTHASPDGLIGDDGLVEIKCPETHTHLATLKGAAIAERYIKQMQWQLRMTGRTWCDFASFDDRLPLPMQLHVTRVERDSAMISDLEEQVREFLGEVQADVALLTERYLKEAA